MQQAANGVESLTVEKLSFEEKEKKLNETIAELKKSLNDCKNEIYSITQDLNRAN
jgi:prefoldin subunit 5